MSDKARLAKLEAVARARRLGETCTVDEMSDEQLAALLGYQTAAEIPDEVLAAIAGASGEDQGGGSETATSGIDAGNK